MKALRGCTLVPVALRDGQRFQALLEVIVVPTPGAGSAEAEWRLYRPGGRVEIQPAEVDPASDAEIRATVDAVLPGLTARVCRLAAAEAST